MSSKNKTILALGADIKSRFCVLKDNKLVLSKEFGNLDNLDNFSKFKNSILKAKAKPDIVAYDQHPQYFSTQFAKTIKSQKKISVQHHYAHIASVLFDKKIDKPVIGVAFDGTGYGTDKRIWGGEFLIVDNLGFKRVAHFKYLEMPGAELAIKEPWKMALSLVYNCIGDKVLKLKLEFVDLKSPDYYNILLKIIRQRFNCPLTSSAGRLFDAVSSLLGVCHYATFEAEAAIKLEKLAMQSKEKGFYEFDIIRENNNWIIGYNKFVKAILKDLKNNKPKKYISRKFHNSVSNVIIKMIDKIFQEYGLKDVVLSGGVFQNKILLDSVKEKIIKKGYNLIYNKEIPVNDLCICLGQAFVALQGRNK